MKFILEDFWILTKTGALIYHYLAKTTYDKQFFGMILSAINSFAEQISNGGLSSFELANKRFSFIEKNEIIFLGCSVLSLKEKAAKKELHEIIKLFFKLYPKDVMNNWDGEIGMFSTFKSEIEKKKK
ncbi:MAG: hypothetical protein ACFFCL_07960 [Promethearchaeota archaeon]